MGSSTFTSEINAGNLQNDLKIIEELFRKYGTLTTGEVARILKISEDRARRRLKWLSKTGVLEETEKITTAGRRPAYKLRVRPEAILDFEISNPTNIEFHERDGKMQFKIRGEEFRGRIQTSFVQVASATITPDGNIQFAEILTPVGTTSVILRSVIDGGPYCPNCGTPLLEGKKCPRCSSLLYGD